MNDKISLISTAILTIFFLVCGVLDILDVLSIRITIFLIFIAIIINIIIVKSKEEDEKNLPD
jgi:hypothetical protein